MIDALKIELTSLRQRISQMKKQADAIQTIIFYLEGESGNIPIVKHRGRPKKGNTEPSQIKQEIIKVIERHGKPMHCKDILDELSESGIIVGGADPRRNLVAHLSLNKTIFKPVGSGYWTLGNRYE